MSEPIGHPIDDVNYAKGYPRATGGDTDTSGPITPWEYEQAAQQRTAQQEVQREAEQKRLVAEHARQVATELAGARLSNGDPTNAPHFQLNADGRELCGQCGETFPCAAYLATNPATVPDSAAREYPDPVTSRSGELLDGVTPEQLRNAAAELGVSPGRLAYALNPPTAND